MLKSEIKKIIKGDVADDEKTLVKYSRDASLLEIKPAVVVYPKNSADVQALVKFVRDKKQNGENISLTPRAGGTDMTGGSIGESVILDFTRYMNRLREVGSNYAIVEPGMFYRDFEKETLKKNLLMPSFPASRELAAIGGMVANNAGGEKTLSYGKTLDYVQQVKAVLFDGKEYTFGPLTQKQLDRKLTLDSAEGQVYRKLYKLLADNFDDIQEARPKVSKNSSGYYLWDVWDKKRFNVAKLFTGSQGTLGIITEVKFRLISPNPYSRLLVIFLKEDDIEKLGRIVNHVLEFRPETFESYDDHTLKLAVKFVPQFISRLRGNVITLGLHFLPELKMVLTGGFPKFVLTAEFTGKSIDEVQEKAKLARQSLREFKLKTHITQSDSESEKYKLIRRESFNLLRKKVKNKKTAPFIDDIVVEPQHLPKFLPQLDDILADYPELTYTVAGHIGNGNFHIIPLVDINEPKITKIIPEVAKRVYDLVFEYGGSMSAEHNDGLIRGPYLQQMFGKKIYVLFERVKVIFDPDGIFNPGKKIDTDPKYVLSHLQHGDR